MGELYGKKKNMKIILCIMFAVLACSCHDISAILGNESLAETRDRSEYVLLCKVEFSGNAYKCILLKPLFEAKSATLPYKEGDIVYSSTINPKTTPYDTTILFYSKHMGEIIMDRSIPVNDGKVYDAGKKITLEEAIDKLTQ